MSIGVDTFHRCTSLKTVQLNATITSVPNNMFWECSSLESVTFSSSITTITDNCFQDSDIKNINIPKTITTIGTGSFVSTNSLESITVDNDSNDFCSVDGVVFSKDMKTLVAYPAAKADTTYSIPDSVNTIREAAFYNYLKLTELTVPASVTSIEAYSFYVDTSSAQTNMYFNGTSPSVGDSAFMNNITIYAKKANSSTFTLTDGKWNGCNFLVTCDVTYDKNGGDTEANPKTQTIQENTAVDTFPSEPTKHMTVTVRPAELFQLTSVNMQTEIL